MPAVTARREKQAFAIVECYVTIMDRNGMIDVDELALGMGVALPIGIGDCQRDPKQPRRFIGYYGVAFCRSGRCSVFKFPQPADDT